MVEKIFLTDSYMKEIDASVEAVDPDGIELDQTIFYPGGGGEPSDIGKISFNGNTFKVVKTSKKGEGILHALDHESGLNVGEKVHCELDWEKRYKFMRHHTAIHVIGGLMEHKYNALYTGGQIGFDRSHYDFDMPELNRELAEKIIQESQEIIDRNLEIRIKVLTKEQALQIPNLVRTEPGRELIKRLNEVRVVEIVGFDIQMDGGTHVMNTKEIGKISLSGFENKGTHRKRINVTVD